MKQRVITAILAGALAMLAMLAPTPIPLTALAVLALVIGLYELAVLVKEQFTYVFLFACLGLAPLLAKHPAVPSPAGFLPLWLVGIVCVMLFAKGSKRSWPLAGLWISASLGSAMWLHEQTAGPAWGTSLVILALVPLWVGDSLALFAGKAFGKHPLAPTISPKKTWEGAIANFVGCLLAAIGTGSLLGVPLAAGIGVGFTLGIAGQAGDLLESWLKRSSGEKDSGGILPGHGGILDRLDSFFATAPINALILALLAPEMFHVKPFG